MTTLTCINRILFRMTKNEAIEMLVSAPEDADLSDDAEELFEALYGRAPVADDGTSEEWISTCYADPDVAAAVQAYDSED